MDEHRSGLKPILRRVWAPRGKRPVVAIHPRDPWRSRSGFVHPPWGRTEWHRSSSVSVELFARSLTPCGEPVGAGSEQEGVGVLDRAGWHLSRRLALPDHVHWLPLPPYPPELPPAERLWPFANTPLVTARPADREALDLLHLDRGLARPTDPALVATIQSATHAHWGPADYSPIT